MVDHPENTQMPSIGQLEKICLVAQRKHRSLAQADLGVGMLFFCSWALSILLIAYAGHLMSEPAGIATPPGLALGYFLAGISTMAIGLTVASKCWQAIEAATAHWLLESSRATEALSARSHEAKAIEESEALSLAVGHLGHLRTADPRRIRRI